MRMVMELICGLRERVKKRLDDVRIKELTMPGKNSALKYALSILMKVYYIKLNKVLHFYTLSLCLIYKKKVFSTSIHGFLKSTVGTLIFLL